MTVTLPLPELIALAVGAALIVAAITALVAQSWYDAALHRRSWIEHDIKPVLRSCANVGRWWTHQLIARPLCAAGHLGNRIHDATSGDREAA